MGKFEHGNLLVSLSEGHRHGYSLAAVVVGLGIGAAGLCKALHRSLVIPWVSWKFFSESERVCYAGGLKNLGNNSFLNVILQALASCDHFVSSLDDLLGSDGVLPEEQPERMPLISGLSSLLKGTQASLKLIVRRGDSGRLKRQIKGNLLMTVAHICVGLQLLFYWIPRMNSVSCCVSCITSISKVEAILYSFESPAPGGKVKPALAYRRIRENDTKNSSTMSRFSDVRLEKLLGTDIPGSVVDVQGCNLVESRVAGLFNVQNA